MEEELTLPQTLFPFPVLRPGQKEFYEDVKDVLTNRGVLLAYAPTGIGKTAAVLSASLEVALKEDKRILFLTSRHSQHRIVIDTLRKIRDRYGISIPTTDIINKMDMCPREDIQGLSRMEFNILCTRERKKRTCPFYRVNPLALQTLSDDILHVEEVKQTCAVLGSCPHATALKHIERSRVIVSDYNYILDIGIRNLLLSKIQGDLSDLILIFDEAHNLPERVRSLYTSSLTKNLLYGCLKESREYIKQPMLDILIKSFFELIPEDDHERYLDKDDFIFGVERKVQEHMMNPLTYSEIISLLDDAVEVVLSEIEDEFYSSYLAGLLDFLVRWQTDQEHIIRISNSEGIHIIPLDPSDYTSDLFRDVHGAILMSGTLHPQKMYSDLLGIINPVFKSYRSPFPPGNRLVLSVGSMTTLYSRRTVKEYRKIGKKISDLSKIIPDNLIVFFPSYQLMNDISEFINPGDRTLIKEKQDWSKEDKSAILQMFHERSDLLFLGVHLGSFSEGIDYQNNSVKGIIIVGLPLDPPSLEKNSLVKYFNQKFGKGFEYVYHMPAFNKILQASGRGIRTPEDRCVIVLLDERFNWPKYKRYFPPDFRPIPTNTPETYIRLFFKGF